MSFLRRKPWVKEPETAAAPKSTATPASTVQPVHEPARTMRPPPPPPVEFLRDAELRTSLSVDAVVTGKLAFTAPTKIDGKLKGELRCTDLLVISSTAIVDGYVKADTVRVEGLVRGEIGETRKVLLRAGSRLIGRLSTDVLVLEEGAFFDGSCVMPRSAQRKEERDAVG